MADTGYHYSNSAGRWVSLGVLTFVYVVGELSHFLLGIVTRPMSQEIEYGDKGCLTVPEYAEVLAEQDKHCFDANSSMSCELIGDLHSTSNATACVWDYSGLGLAYQILAGPAFVAVFTISGVLIAMLSDRYNRKIIVSVCLVVLTATTTLTGAANAYWQLVVLRMAIGAGESAFSPACSSMIADMFSQARRGFALGVFNWGIYFGYGLSYAFGNFITEADITGMGWRWSYYISGMLGFVVLCFLLFIVKEPERRIDVADRNLSEEMDLSSATKNPKKSFIKNLMGGESGLLQIFRALFRTPVIMLMIAASVRHTAGFTWAYNTQLYFSTYYPSYNLGIWITSVSIFGGTIGVAVGGLVSDKLVKKLGMRARVYVLAASQLIATPFATGVLYFSPPLAFYSLLGSYIFAEMWFGVLFAVLLELVPSRVRSTTLAIFLFVINNIGGNAPVLIEPLRNQYSYRTALLIMYPGLYFISAILFFISSFFVSKKPQN